jgi:hypothetical protein
MSTPKQIAASRANGARSKGPITAQGKRNSSRNSIRHGLLAETVVLEEEDTGRFFDLLNDFIGEHQPATPTETMLVETITVASWRRSRIWGMQKENFDHDIASCNVDTDSPALCATLALRGSPESIRSHEVLLRYEVAFDRQISRSLLRLQHLQDRRAQRPQKAKETTPEQPIKDQGPGDQAPDKTAALPAPKSSPAKRTQQPIENKNQAPPIPAPQAVDSTAQNRSVPAACPKFSLTGVKRLF